MWGFHDGMGWWMLSGGMWMAAFWVVIIGFVVWAAKKIADGKAERREEGELPLEITKMRLARGEITREQYEDLRRLLG